MFDLSKHPYFTPYTDPKSGIVSYILTEKVAPLQRQFYFAQPSVTADGKYLWFLCFNPPARYMTLGVLSLDPENPFIKNFPYAAPQGGNPCVTPEGDGVYFGVGNIVCKLDNTSLYTAYNTCCFHICKISLLYKFVPLVSVKQDVLYCLD